MSISGHDINSQTYKDAMINANRADKDFVPLLVRNNKDVKKLLYLMKLDEQYKGSKSSGGGKTHTGGTGRQSIR